MRDGEKNESNFLKKSSPTKTGDGGLGNRCKIQYTYSRKGKRDAAHQEICDLNVRESCQKIRWEKYPCQHDKEQNPAAVEVNGEQLTSIALNKFDERSITKGSPPATLVNHCAEVKNSSLSFRRCCSLWESIESMEVFKKFPQKPHFHPLDNCNEESREGLAISYMVIFANVVEKVSKLQFDDPTSVINSCMGTLLELEPYGFNVHPVKERLDELLSKKRRHAQLEEETKQLDKRATTMKQIIVESTFDEEIKRLDKKRTVLLERLALATSKKEKKDHQIAKGKSKLDGIFEELRKLRFDFGNLVASPW